MYSQKNAKPATCNANTYINSDKYRKQIFGMCIHIKLFFNVIGVISLMYNFLTEHFQKMKS